MDTQVFDFMSIQLSRQSKEALYAQLYHQICALIVEGKLSHGFVLPPVRKLAKCLSVNAGTVVSAYKMLETNGYIFSRAGSGSYVAELPAIDGLEAEESDAGAADELAPIPEGKYINLAGIALNPDVISVEMFKEVLIEVLDRDRGYAFGYQESQGFYPLRESIAESLRADGVGARAGNVQIISGAQQGIDIVAKALLCYGDYVFTESPTYPGAIAAFRSRGAKIVAIPMEDDGMAIDALEENLRKFRPKLIYVMPNIQNPTGYSYAVHKRSRLMGLARYYDAAILEDDYISELHYGEAKMAPLKAIDRDDRVIYLKSFSKIFMPGLRLAFLTVPEKHADHLLAVKQNSDISTSGLTQRAFDLYLRKGIWHAHIESIRGLYHQRFQLTMRSIEAHMPSCVRVAAPRGGLSIWLTLPEGLSARKIADEARRREVLVTEGAAFFPRRAADRYLRISFATATEREIASGVRILGKLIEAAFRKLA